MTTSPISATNVVSNTFIHEPDIHSASMQAIIARTFLS